MSAVVRRGSGRLCSAVSPWGAGDSYSQDAREMARIRLRTTQRKGDFIFMALYSEHVELSRLEHRRHLRRETISLGDLLQLAPLESQRRGVADHV